MTTGSASAERRATADRGPTRTRVPASARPLVARAGALPLLALLGCGDATGPVRAEFRFTVNGGSAPARAVTGRAARFHTGPNPSDETVTMLYLDMRAESGDELVLGIRFADGASPVPGRYPVDASNSDRTARILMTNVVPSTGLMELAGEVVVSRLTDRVAVATFDLELGSGAQYRIEGELTATPYEAAATEAELDGRDYVSESVLSSRRASRVVRTLRRPSFGPDALARRRHGGTRIASRTNRRGSSAGVARAGSGGHDMSVRDFTDDQGVTWRVWAVDPEAVQPRTRAEDYLGDYLGGWLCFESATERRRLAGYPADWGELDDERLTELLKRASVVARRRSSHFDSPDDRAT